MGNEPVGKFVDNLSVKRRVDDPQNVVRRLLADADSALAADESLERDLEVDDRIRHEWGAIGIIDRIAAHKGQVVRITMRGAGLVEGYVEDVAVDWIMLTRPGRDTYLMAGAILGARGLSSVARDPHTVKKTDLARNATSLLREFASARSTVSLVLIDGSCLEGTVDRAGADHVELAIHPTDTPRRTRNVTETICVPFTAVAVVSRN